MPNTGPGLELSYKVQAGYIALSSYTLGQREMGNPRITQAGLKVHMFHCFTSAKRI